MPDCRKLHVFTARFNPLGWQVPHRHALDWCTHVLDSGAVLTVCEVQYGRKPFQYDSIPHIRHVGLRADSWAWSKENALMEGIRRTPEAEYICWGDADAFHERPGWVPATIDALEHYRLVQTWSQALDLGPGGEVGAVHRSFTHCYRHLEPLVAEGPKFWKFDGGYKDYPHTGFHWACKREMLDWTGGLFELCGMGSGDHLMALAAVGQVERSWPGGTTGSFKAHALRWQNRVTAYVNGRVGCVDGVLRHRFHGSKQRRYYLDRWQMFVKHGFDPDTDLKRNSSGVLEWAGNKPELEREWDLYLRARREDDNCN